jgi:hypothetical protein
MDAVVIVDPIEYQRHPGETSDPAKLLRTLRFGEHHEGPVTFRRSARQPRQWHR